MLSCPIARPFIFIMGSPIQVRRHHFETGSWCPKSGAAAVQRIHCVPKFVWQHWILSPCIPITQEGRQGWIISETNNIVNDNQGIWCFDVKRKFYVAYCEWWLKGIRYIDVKKKFYVVFTKGDKSDKDIWSPAWISKNCRVCNYSSIPKFRRCKGWSLEMD